MLLHIQSCKAAIVHENDKGVAHKDVILSPNFEKATFVVRICLHNSMMRRYQSTPVQRTAPENRIRLQPVCLFLYIF